jgi:hypothetical protein
LFDLVAFCCCCWINGAASFFLNDNFYWKI